MNRTLTFLLLLSGVQLQKNSEEVFLNKQSDYQLKPERAELIRYNKDYINYISVKYFKYNRTCTAFNFSTNFNVAIGNDLQIVAQAYKFASNEYRLFPLRFGVNACKAYDANILGSQLSVKLGNFRGCPILKGKTYSAYNFAPNQEKLPPLVPSGSYKLDLQFLHSSKELYLISAYGTISRPIVR